MKMIKFYQPLCLGFVKIELFSNDYPVSSLKVSELQQDRFNFNIMGIRNKTNEEK